MSPEVTVNWSTRAVVISRLNWGWTYCFQFHSCGCWHEAFMPPYMDPSWGTWISPEQGIQEKVIQGKDRSTQDGKHSLFITWSQKWHTITFSSVLLVTQTKFNVMHTGHGHQGTWIFEMVEADYHILLAHYFVVTIAPFIIAQIYLLPLDTEHSCFVHYTLSSSGKIFYAK